MMNSRKWPGRIALAGTVILLGMMLLGGCARIETAAIQTGMVTSPYYQLGDTTWEHGGIEEYYFNQIPSELNEIYRELYERIRDGEDSADLYAVVPLENFWTAYYSVLADHPEFFWVGSNIEVQQNAISGNVVSYKITTTVEPDARQSMRSSLEEAADTLISQMDPYASDYEKIKYVYEYLIDTVDYDLQSADNQNIQSALLQKRSVCAGYARAFQYVLHRMGMFCTYVTGTITTGGDHAWNIVRIGERYYHVDVTWGDPVFVGEAENTASVRSKNYNYLCCTDADISGTHRISSQVAMPECTDDSYNYYKLGGMFYETFDYEQVYGALMNSVWEERPSVTMKFGSSEGYEEAKYAMFQGNMLQDPAQYLMDIYGTQTWNYSYHTDDAFYLITIFWQNE